MTDPDTSEQRTSELAWTLVTALLIAAAAGITADVARRLLGPGLDFLGVFVTVILGFLVLLVANALTSTGQKGVGRMVSIFGVDADISADLLTLFRRGVNRLLARLGIARGREQWARLGLALSALVLIFMVSRLLPLLARYYNDRGQRQYQAGSLISAISSYGHAISVNPDYALAHYNLAAAREDVLDYDAAISEYQTALQSDARLYPAYNNLARLYTLRKQDYGSALYLIERGLALQPEHPNVRYSLYKNRGWANLGLKLIENAGRDLRQALAIRPDGAAAHCLLAQTLEAAGQPGDAMGEWEACVAYSAAGENVEPEWSAIAQERLNAGVQP